MTGGGSSSSMIATAVRAASTGPEVLADVIDGYTLDGVVLTTGDRVLLKDQASGIQNGIYEIGLTTPDRAADMDSLMTFEQGYIVPVIEGVAQSDTLWMLTTAMASVGSSLLTFVAPRSEFANLVDFDNGVVKSDGMVMIWDAANGMWKPTITSTSLPAGGTTGQALTKASGTDYDFVFRTLVPAGGTTGQVLSKIDATDYNGQWVDVTLPPTSVRTNSTTADTPVIGDSNGFIFGSNAADITNTIPPNSSVAFPIGTTLTWVQLLAGKNVVAAGAGVTVQRPATFLAQSAEQWATIAAVKIASDTWVLTGQLEAA